MLVLLCLVFAVLGKRKETKLIRWVVRGGYIRKQDSGSVNEKCSEMWGW